MKVDTMTSDLCWQPTTLTWRSPACCLFFFSPLQIRNLWNEEDDEERDEIILVLVIYEFGLYWVCIVFEENYGMRKMTKREMGSYFGFGLGLCSYVLFWFVLGLWYRGRSEEKGFFWEEMAGHWEAEHRERERAEHRVLENCYYVFFIYIYFLIMCWCGNLWEFQRLRFYIYVCIYIYIYIYIDYHACMTLCLHFLDFSFGLEIVFLLFGFLMGHKQSRTTTRLFLLHDFKINNYIVLFQ